MHLGLFSHPVTSVSHGPVTSNRAVGPVLKLWTGSSSTATAGGGESLTMVTKPLKSVEEVFISPSSPERLNRAFIFLCIHES